MIYNIANEKKIILNDITVAYDDCGYGTIPIIFIHGFPFDKSMWYSQMNILKETHRVLAYDIRGFGNSTSGNEDFSIRLFADDLINFMDSLQIDKAIVCGLSMGGYILLNAVIYYPERFTALILADTQCIADSTEGKIKRNNTAMEIGKHGLHDFAEGFINSIFTKETIDNKNPTVEKIKHTILSTSALTIIRTLNALANRTEMCKRLNEINIPVLIICGEEDSITTPDQAKFMHKHIPNSKIRFLEKAGHMSNLENAGEFNKYITDFIDEIH